MNPLKSSAAVAMLMGALAAIPSRAQQPAKPAAVSIPRFVSFTGELKTQDRKPASGVVEIDFLLFEEEDGGTPLWHENQRVTLDTTGHFSVALGANTTGGLPLELFASKKARWLEIEPQGLPVPDRILLLSVPYAAKAGDAETIGGLPPSAFLRADALSRGNFASAQTSSAISENTPAGSGTTNYIPRWTNGATLGNSALFQSGAGSAAKIGINTTAPATTLDVNGGLTARGAVQLLSKAAATSTHGATSQPLTFQASTFSSTTHAAVGPKFQWQAEPAANNTSTPGATINLLYGAAGAPAETGLSIAGNGRITFAPGQTFPGTGNGTITGITPGTALTGGGTSGTITLNLDTSKVPLLAAANTFTGNQSIAGSVAATSFTGSGSGLTDLPGANVSGPVAAATNATNLGGKPASAYQPAGSYASLGVNAFIGNQTVTGNLTASGTIQGAAATFSGAVNAAGVTLPAAGTSTAALAFNSQPLDLVTSAFNSSTSKAENQAFRWLAESKGTNTSSPSGMLNLLFGSDGAAPTETGLSIASNGQVKFAIGQTFPGTGTITGITAGTGLSGGGTGGAVTLSLNTSYSDGRYASLGANNNFIGTQIFNNSIGIGVAAPGYPLHVNGTIRAETGLSLGGGAMLSVDAPYVTGGHFMVTSDGKVGINNPTPKNALDVVGNISTNAGVAATSASIGAALSAGSVQIGGDRTMSAAPHLYLTGYVPGPMAPLFSQVPIVSIPSKAIVITRMVASGLSTCPQQGPLTFDISSKTATYHTITLSSDPGSYGVDSGPLSIPIPAGTLFWARVNPPDCGPFGTAPTQIAVSIEYVMQ